MAESTARIGIYADDRASATVKSVQGSLQGLATQAKSSILTGVGLGAGISAFGLMQRAIGGVTDFLGDSVKGAIADEESISRLTTAIRANVPAWNGDTRAIEERIKAGQLLGFTDDELRSSLTGLVAATHDVAKAQDIQNVAMNLARFRHISLQEASDALVKVEAGRYRVLTTLGIVLQKGATQTEALAAVQKVAAGEAKAYGDTTSGAMAEAGIAFDEAGESLARGLVPAIKEFAHFARDVLAPNLGIVAVGFAGIATVILVALIPAIVAATIAAGPWLLALGLVVGAGVLIARTFDSPAGASAATWRWAGITKRATQDVTDAVDGMYKVPEVIKAHFGRALTEMEIAERDMAAVAAAIGEDVPQEMADGMLREQQRLADPAQQLIDFMAKALAPAQIMARDQGFLASKELAAGLASNNPLVVQKAHELQAAAIAELSSVSGAYGGGAAIAGSWVSGITASLSSGYSMTSTWIGKYQRLLGGSLPEEGPLKGDTAEKGGLAIAQSWLGGMGKVFKGGMLNLPTLPGAGGGMAFAGAGGGSPVVIQLQVDGRTLAEIVDRQLYYMKPVQGALGRG